MIEIPNNAVGWHTLLAEVIACDHPADFFPKLCDAVQSVVPFSEPVIYLFGNNTPPVALYEKISPAKHATGVANYIEGAYLIDPVYRAIRELRPRGVYELDALVPKNFRRSEYYRSYYHRLGVSDEVNFLVYTNDSSCVNISLVRKRCDPRFSRKDLSVLRTIEPVVHELVLRMLRAPGKNELNSGSRSSERMESGLQNLGVSLLTVRELQVLQTMIRGHDSRSIAENLCVTLDTVKMHRKNIYRKLKVASAAEFFSLVIDALVSYPASKSADPLAPLLPLQK